MIVAGVDVGTETVKLVILKDGEIIFSEILATPSSTSTYKT